MKAMPFLLTTPSVAEAIARIEAAGEAYSARVLVQEVDRALAETSRALEAWENKAREADELRAERDTLRAFLRDAVRELEAAGVDVPGDVRDAAREPHGGGDG